MQITQLGYIGIAAKNLDAWRVYAGEFLGMQIEGTDRLTLRMDERAQRILIEPSERDGVAFLGFEATDNAVLANVAEALNAAGIEVSRATESEKAARCVAEMIWFLDPDMNRIEVYSGARLASEPFVASRPIGGFRTGELGVGHIALRTNNFEAMENFYQNTLHFRLSDFIKAEPFRASFFHVNRRHHTLAVIEGPERGAHHIMIEYNFMDDVGRLYDMALKQPDSITVTLGRHSNDHMFSFYSKTPGGFMIETGWGGRLIEEDTWRPEALYGPSIWGHERSWLPPEARLSARRQLELAAERGVLEPTDVTPSTGFNLKDLDQ